MNIAEALQNASEMLAPGNLREPQKDARLLLGFAIGRPKEFLYAHPEYELTTSETTAFFSVISRRASHEPIQYITGTAEFYGLDFAVSPSVLIPRPETEILVEKAIESLSSSDKAPRFSEVGAGSGCISVAVLKSLPSASAIAVDTSADALEVASQNAARHEVLDRVEFRLSDVFENVAEDDLDAVLSNPPYIPLADTFALDREVRDFEPINALTDSGDGSGIIRRIVRDSYHKLRPGGVLLLEIGYGQAADVTHLFEETLWTNVEVFDDLQAIPRILRAFRR